MLRLQARSPCQASTLPQGVPRAQRQARLVVRASDQASSSAPAEAAAPMNVCGTCGVPLSEKPGGCNGEGRIMGGLGSVPGFGWWPIKAYRPCPKASEAGIAYQRTGQVLDEVLFGNGRDK